MMNIRNKQQNQTHVILFVDINGTIIANDSAKNKDVDSAILQLLAENFSSVWDASKTTVEMTYRKYIEKYLLVRTANDTNNVQARTEDYKGFIDFLTITKHPLFKEITSTFNKIKQILSTSDVFPSFLNLIE